jgi:endonuclease III
VARAKRTEERRGVAEAEAPPSRVVTSTAQRARQIHERLSRAIAAPRIELDFRNPWELLVATILAAQSTDRTVNLVTPALFMAYPTPAALGAAPQDEVERLVRETGFFRNKAKAIRAASRLVAERFGGEVPRTMEELVTLPGVARKTANVVLGNAYRIALGITVDRHTGRVARRLGVVAEEEEDPVKIEAELCAIFPQDDWIDVGLRLQLHGRYVCTARAPDCRRCPLNELCPSRRARPEGTVDERASLEAERVATRGEPAAEGPRAAFTRYR